MLPLPRSNPNEKASNFHEPTIPMWETTPNGIPFPNEIPACNRQREVTDKINHENNDELSTEVSRNNRNKK